MDFFAYLLPLIASGDVQVPLELALEPQKTWYLAGSRSPGVSIRSRRSFHTFIGCMLLELLPELRSVSFLRSFDPWDSTGFMRGVRCQHCWPKFKGWRTKLVGPIAIATKALEISPPVKTVPTRRRLTMLQYKHGLSLKIS